MIANLLSGWLTLALSVLWGYQLARKVFAERDRFCLLIVSLGLALVSLLLSGAYLRRWFSPEALWLPTCGLLLLGSALLAKRSAQPLEKTSLPLSVILFFAFGWPAVLLYALFELSTGMVIDGDFFVHVASIGLFEQGHYPPLNYFLGIPTGGHFGRQLLIASFSRFSGLQFLSAEWILTCLLMLLSFALLFCLLREHSSSPSQAMLGTGMAFFAANTGSRIGLADTLGNHNPVAFFFLIIVSWAVLRALKVGGPSIAAAACVLGIDAMVYETHFGLIGLTMPLALVCVPSARRATVAKRVLAIGLGSLLVASTAGGTITDLATRPSGQSHAQRQQVSLTIPKAELFMLRMDNMRPSRPFEGKMRPWSADFTPSQGYTFALSPRIRDLFWYPSWLFPLAMGACCVLRQPVGVWFGGLAFFAWLVPSVVGFGFFEGEALRWLFVSGVGSAVVFGLALGMLWDRAPKRWWSVGLLAVVLWVCSAGLVRSARDLFWALANPGQPLPIGRPGVVPQVGLIPDPFALLSHHYSLTRDDFEAARWLRENSPRQARVLADDDHQTANYRCTMFGLSGRLPAGYLPPVTDSTEPSGYRRSLQVERFWEQGDSRLLQGIVIDYLVVHPHWHKPQILDRLRRDPKLKLEHQNETVEIYSCQLPSPERRTESLQVAAVELEGVQLSLRASHSGAHPLEWVTVGFINEQGQLVGGPGWYPISSWPAGQERTLSLKLSSPHEAGQYEVTIWGGRADGTEPGSPLGPMRIEP